jgi:hypothetical protein
MMDLSAGELIARFGGHPIRELGIDLDGCDGLERWLVAACLYRGRVPEEVAARAFRGLEGAGFGNPASIADRNPVEIEALLAAADYPAPDAAAHRLWRVSQTLKERHGGSLEALANECDLLEDLAARLSGLAPGFGAAGVAGFLRPLRDRWIQALELPLHPAARAAAVHLGLIAEGEDSEGEPGALRAALRGDPSSPSLTDAEFALARLGARACLRDRRARCPLGDACPAR